MMTEIKAEAVANNGSLWERRWRSVAAILTAYQYTIVIMTIQRQKQRRHVNMNDNGGNNNVKNDKDGSYNIQIKL